MALASRPQGASLYSRLSVAGAAATGHRRSANIDVLRATAALMVLVGHAYFLAAGPGAKPSHNTGLVIATFSSGVWLFFAISGYLIAGPFLRALMEGRPQPDSGRYAVRRAARILPAYWLALIAALALVTGSKLVHWWQLPLHAFLGQDFVPHEPNRFLFVAWTLSVEAMFYVFVPLAAWLTWRAVRRRAVDIDVLAKGIVAIWILSIAWRTGVSFVVTPERLIQDDVPAALAALRWVLPAFLYAFAPGMLIFLGESSQAAERRGAWAVYRRLKQHPLALGVAAAALLVGGGWIAQHGGRWSEIGGTLMALPSGLALIAMLGEGRRRERLGAVLAPLGLVSYGIYLWHAVARDAIARHAPHLLPGAGTGPHAWPAEVVLLALVTIPLALASWLLIERPLLRWTANWDRRTIAPRTPLSERLAPPALEPQQAPGLSLQNSSNF